MASKGIVRVAVGVIQNVRDEILLAQRHQQAHQGGFWEFPGGKIEAGENVLMALTRELHEELGIQVLSSAPLITIHHAYPELSVQLNVHRVGEFFGEPMGMEGQNVRWVKTSRLHEYSFPAANVPIITAAQLPDFYAILDAESTLQTYVAMLTNSSAAEVDIMLSSLQQLLNQNIKLIQARLKSFTSEQIQQFMAQAYPLCKTNGALLLLNSALSHDGILTEGVHLTSSDLMTLKVRPIHAKWVGASCHTLEELQHAQTIGVDFAVLAPVQPTLTHPNAKPLGWERFSQWLNEINLPVYALGGLQKCDLLQAKHAGAQGIAGIRLFCAH